MTRGKEVPPDMNSGIALSRAVVPDELGTDWMEDALCRERAVLFDATMAPEREHKQPTRVEKDALRVCSECPVLDTCRGWSLTREVAGVAGGMTHWERKRRRPKGLGAA